MTKAISRSQYTLRPISDARTSLSLIAMNALPSGLPSNRRIAQRHNTTVARIKKYWNVSFANPHSLPPNLKVAGRLKLMPSSPPVSGFSVSARK